jgi:trimethylamine-N-oxide reductase (cytochrome c)
VAKKLEKFGGVYEDAYNKYTGGKTIEEWIKYGYETSGVTDRISWEELKQKGYWLAPLKRVGKRKAVLVS